jgi:hypothetical protein
MINGEIINAIIDTRIVVVGGGIIKSKGRAEATIYFEKINIEIKTEVQSNFDVPILYIPIIAFTDKFLLSRFITNKKTSLYRYYI